jgi:hypothetical protein
MTYRRKVPKRAARPQPPASPPLSAQLQALAQQIAECDARERYIEMELQDCLLDVTTPEDSEDDQPLGVRRKLEGANHQAATEELNNFLRASVIPSSDLPFASLYDDPKYVKRAQRKFLKMRRLARGCDFNKAFHCRHFWRHYSRIRELYPSFGNREDLVGLVAIYCWLNNHYDEDHTSEESGSEIDLEFSSDDDEDLEPPPPPNPNVPLIAA